LPRRTRQGKGPAEEVPHGHRFVHETAERIGDSPFSLAASEETDKYPIELFEDPFFDPSEVDALLKCLEKWRGSLQEEDKDAFLIVENLLLEAKERGVGIYFKF